MPKGAEQVVKWEIISWWLPHCLVLWPTFVWRPGQDNMKPGEGEHPWWGPDSDSKTLPMLEE